MGGYGAMMLAARHPDLFVGGLEAVGRRGPNLAPNGAAMSASSTFDGAPPTPSTARAPSQEIRWRGHNPTDLAENLRDVDLQVRTANGTPDARDRRDPLSADTARALEAACTWPA